MGQLFVEQSAMFTFVAEFLTESNQNEAANKEELSCRLQVSTKDSRYIRKADVGHAETAALENSTNKKII